MHNLLIETIGQAVIAVLIVFPLWKIFSKAGKNPALALFVFIPFIGFLLVGLLLAFSPWPSVETASSKGET